MAASTKSSKDKLETVGKEVLPLGERTLLDRCEATIRQGVQTFLDVAEALMQIREHRLYRIDYGTFEEYCTQKWQISKTHANRLIAAKEVTDLVAPMGVTPQNERQARELGAMDEEIRTAAIEKAKADTGSEKVPASAVIAAAKSVLPFGPLAAEFTGGNVVTRALANYELVVEVKGPGWHVLDGVTREVLASIVTRGDKLSIQLKIGETEWTQLPDAETFALARYLVADELLKRRSKEKVGDTQLKAFEEVDDNEDDEEEETEPAPTPPVAALMADEDDEEEEAETLPAPQPRPETAQLLRPLAPPPAPAHTPSTPVVDKREARNETAAPVPSPVPAPATPVATAAAPVAPATVTPAPAPPPAPVTTATAPATPATPAPAAPTAPAAAGTPYVNALIPRGDHEWLQQQRLTIAVALAELRQLRATPPVTVGFVLSGEAQAALVALTDAANARTGTARSMEEHLNNIVLTRASQAGIDA